VAPVFPVAPFSAGAPVAPVAPVGPAGPGTAITAGAGEVTTVGLSHPLNANAASTVEIRIEYFMTNAFLYVVNENCPCNVGQVKTGTKLPISERVFMPRVVYRAGTITIVSALALPRSPSAPVAPVAPV
jgi:hypothetical protein